MPRSALGLGRVLLEALAGVEIVLGRGQKVLRARILLLSDGTREVALESKIRLELMEPLVRTTLSVPCGWSATPPAKGALAHPPSTPTLVCREKS